MNLWLLPNFIVASAEGIVPDHQQPEVIRQAINLLQELNRAGCRYRVDGGFLHYAGPDCYLPALCVDRETIVLLLSPPPPEPCRGGCGKPMSPGQRCVPCATQAVREGWMP
jgi:hypothetical protein